MENSLAIYTQGLKKSYGRVQALRGVDLAVQRGEVFGFLGPNGAGKTTTIRCLLDLIRPDAGELRVFGIDPQADPTTVRLRTGYLPGELHIEDNLSVENALRFFNHLRHNAADWTTIRALAARLELDLRTAVKNLSKGNKQKVGLVQALMHKPELLLLDEPTSGLDPLMQQEVLSLVDEARQAGATVFFSSHILSEVESIADRVAIIRQGIVAEIVEPSSLLNRAVRRVRVRFHGGVEAASLETIPEVKLLSQTEGQGILLQVEGEMDGLIKALSAYPVIDLETEKPSLEEIFLSFYRGEQNPSVRE